MSYHVRVLSTAAEVIPLDALRQKLMEKQSAFSLSTDEDPSFWTEAILSHADGVEIAAIDWTSMAEGSLGEQELEEFAESVEDALPASGARWLLDYFTKVRSIYAFQCLSGTDHNDGWEILNTLRALIWNAAPSIMQADLEGFSNEDGYHILWQFSGEVEGEWAMAVLDQGSWKRFSMDLGNPAHRSAFLAGEVPVGVEML